MPPDSSDRRDDDCAVQPTGGDQAVDRTSRLIEAAIDQESGRTPNNWLACFKTRLTVAILNLGAAKKSGMLEVTKAVDLRAQLAALQQEVETGWEDPEFRVGQMRAAVRKLAAILVEIPLQ